MDLWAVTLQVGATYQSLAVLWSVKPLWAKQWATCEEVGGANVRGEIIMMTGLEQGNHHYVWKGMKCNGEPDC